MTFAAFEKVRASKINLEVLPGTIVGWAQRVTNSSGATSTTDVAVLELSDIPVTAGRIYEITSSVLRLDTSLANDAALARIRYTTDGSTPSVSSTILPGGQAQAVLANPAVGEDRTIVTRYVPASDQTLSLLLCVSRVSGSGTIVVQADGTNTLCELTIRDGGVSPGDTGIDR